MDNIISIDVSKDTLDVHRLTDGRHNQFANDKTGHTKLLKWISLQPDSLIIFEGQTMGAALQLTPKPINAENMFDLRELLSARRALIKDRTAAKARNATAMHPLVKQQLAKRLRQIECDITKIDGAMLQSSQQD